MWSVQAVHICVQSVVFGVQFSICSVQCAVQHELLVSWARGRFDMSKRHKNPNICFAPLARSKSNKIQSKFPFVLKICFIDAPAPNLVLKSFGRN